MQNSIWKLTILAGVIGVGFLFVLQAQNGLNQQGEDGQLVPAQPNAGPGGLALDNSSGAGDSSAAELWDRPTQSDEQSSGLSDIGEPTPPKQFEPDFDAVPDQFEPLPSAVATTQEPGDFPGFDPDARLRPAIGNPPITQEKPVPSIVTVGSPPDFGPGFEPEATETPSEGALPFPEPGSLDDRGLPAPSTLSGTDNLAPLPTEPVSPVEENVAGSPESPLPFPPLERPNATTEAPEPLPEFDPGAELIGSAPAQPEETSEKKAARLMTEAKLAVNSGQLLTAREKAEAASKIAVVYGPLEMRPEALLAKIDGMLDRGIDSTTTEATTSEPPFIGLPETGELKPEGGLPPPAPTPSPDAVLSELPSPFPGEARPEASEPSQLLPLSVPEPSAIDPIDATVTVESEPAPSARTIAGTAELPGDAPSAKQRPELTIEKIAPSEATLSEEMIYSIHIANRGQANAAQVVVEDHIPKGCRLVGTIPQAELIGTKLLWRLGHLPSGEKKRILVKVVPIEEGEIGSIATVSFVSEVSTRTAIRQPESADLRLSIKAPQQAAVGQGVVFSFQIENTGRKDAQDVKLQDIIPVGFEHPAGEDLTYDVGTIAAGDSFEIDLELKAVKPGQHTNRAIVKTADANVESNATVEIVAGGGLKLTAEASAPRGVIGQRFTQKITATNNSSEPVSGASIILAPAKQLRVISASDGGVLEAGNKTCRWMLPAVGPGQSVTVEAVAVAAESGIFNSLVQLTQPGQELQNVQVVREIGGVAALHLELKDVPATAFPGDEFPVVVRLLNRGTSADSGVAFSVVIPPELEFVSARGPVKNLPAESSGGKLYIPFATIPELGEGASVDFEVTLKARDSGRPKLRAEVQSVQLAEPVASEAAIVVIDTAP